jgi:hypothetical protein
LSSKGTGGTAEENGMSNQIPESLRSTEARKKSETSGGCPYLILHATRTIAEGGDYVPVGRMALAGQLGRFSRGANAPS